MKTTILNITNFNSNLYDRHLIISSCVLCNLKMLRVDHLKTNSLYFSFVSIFIQKLKNTNIDNIILKKLMKMKKENIKK